MSSLEVLVGLWDWRSWMVLRRNALVHFRNWKTAIVPPAMEPVIFFLAFGIGLGTFVGTMVFDGMTISYVNYIAPGLMAYTSFSTASFEALYGSYVRMFYQKTWDGMLGTQVELVHILWGEILWAGCRGGINGCIVGVVLTIFHFLGLVELVWPVLPLLVVCGFLAAWAFASFALIFTALVPSIDHMNYPVFMIGIPLGLISHTYFPLAPQHPVFFALLQLNPLYHLAETNRSWLLTGAPNLHLLGLVLSALVWLTVCVLINQPLMRRRVLGD